MSSNKFDRIDELLESTSAEKRIKFDFSEIETTESKIAIEKEPEEMPAPTIDVTPFEEIEEPIIEEPAVEEPVVEEIIEEEPEVPAEEEPVEEAPAQAAPVVAPILLDEVPEDVEPEVKQEKKAKKEKKEKQPKDKTSKTKFLQIALIVIVSIATLWTVMYTVDHTLAAQGISPMFAISETEYDDHSLSYKCLGYKVQFMFDSNDRLTQKCVPAWKDGPNDIREQQGLIFEKN